MRKLFTYISIVLFTTTLQAQQVGMYGHSFYKPMLFNPAFAGSDNATNAMLLHRVQWNDFKGSPRLTAFTIDGSLLSKKVGLGFSLISDRKGITNRTIGSLSYSYKITINEKSYLSMGLSLGVINQTLDFSKILIENSMDPNLFSDTQRKTTFDGNVGLALVLDQFEFGVAVPQILQNKINYVDNTNVRGYYSLARHYMTSLKYRFFIAKEKGISIAPQALVRFVPHAPFQFDASVTFDWKNKFWVGATYKSGYALAANVGFGIHKQLFIGYSYDFIIGNIGKYSGISHEIMINFRFGESKKSETVTAKIKEKEKPVEDNKDYEELVNTLQAQVDDTEKKIKELDAKLKKRPKDADKKNVKSDSALSSELTGLLYGQILKKIEAMFEKPKATPEEVQELREEISSYFDSEFADSAAQVKLKEQYELLNQTQDVAAVMVKGVVILEGIESQVNYSAVSITVIDQESNKTIGTYNPNSKSGQYLFILSPGKKYTIRAVNNGYQPYSTEFIPAENKMSYEVNQDIRMKKAGQ